MDFVFTAAPERIAASMVRPMAWAAIDRGHQAMAVQVRRLDGAVMIEPEDKSQGLPDFPFAYGHTGLVEAIARGAVEGWRVDWSPDRFDRELWIEKLGGAMWNSSAKILSLTDALDQWRSGRMHLCPSGADSGPKAFKGMACDRSELTFELARASRGNVLDPNMRVALSNADAPDQEWRCVFVKGQLVASGRYMDEGKVSCERGADASVESFAREAASVWLPGNFCVLDVAKKGAKWGVMEFNSLHSSGLYDIDRSAVVDAVAQAWSVQPVPTKKLSRMP